MQPPTSSHPDPAARRQASLQLWLANVAGGIAVGTAYLSHLPEGASPRTSLFVGLGLVSSVATLALGPALLSWLALRFLSDARLQGLVQALAGAAFLVLLKADTIVFSLLGYHFNSAVWNVMLTSGSEDAVVLGGEVWWPVALVVALLTGLEYLAWRGLARRAARRGPRPARHWALRPAAACAAVLLAVVSAEKTIYAAAELEGDRQVHHASQVLPMYTGLRVSQLLPESLEAARTANAPVELRDKGGPLAWPREWPRVDEHGPRPNVLFLVLDSWRRDMLAPETTPRLWESARGARRFEDHWSGGNGTRFGVFSMLYGLHGSYWFSVLEERRSPVLLDVLAGLGYERAVFSSASQSFPEFRETAWVGMEDAVHDDHPSELSYERDRDVARAFTAWLEKRDAAAPFFAFVLLDAPHQPYWSPPEGPFQPAAEELNYIELGTSNAPELVARVFNRYRNALASADEVAGDVLAELARRGLAEDTLVVVTGDHGEEFQETGFWGHTSNFSAWQLAVPLFVSGPGVEPGVETRPTSHLDLPATVLELLGADPAARGGWTLGASLLDPPERRTLVAAGWDHLGLLAGAATFRVRMGGKGPFDVEAFDAGWRPIDAPVDVYERHQHELEQLAQECRRFLARP